jgi:hypothetical protein
MTADALITWCGGDRAPMDGVAWEAAVRTVLALQPRALRTGAAGYVGLVCRTIAESASPVAFHAALTVLAAIAPVAGDAGAIALRSVLRVWQQGERDELGRRRVNEWSCIRSAAVAARCARDLSAYPASVAVALPALQACLQSSTAKVRAAAQQSAYALLPSADDALRQSFLEYAYWAVEGGGGWTDHEQWRLFDCPAAYEDWQFAKRAVVVGRKPPLMPAVARHLPPALLPGYLPTLLGSVWGENDAEAPAVLGLLAALGRRDVPWTHEQILACCACGVGAVRLAAIQQLATVAPPTGTSQEADGPRLAVVP